MSNSSIEKIIKENAEQYYTTGEQTISDDVFDALVDEVRKENPNSDILKTGWGFKPGSKDKIKHRYCKIGSLNKVKTVDALRDKIDCSPSVCVAAKLDGLSCVLYYEKGKLVKAITRGDGEFGIDITNKVIIIQDNFSELPDFTFTGAVRGEILMTPDNFAKYQHYHPEAANARNSAAGIINSDTTEDLKYLNIFVYTVVANELKDYDREVEVINRWLKRNFNDFVVPYYVVESENLSDDLLLKIRDDLKKTVTIDGLVITHHIVKYDYENKTYSYNQIAYKFQDELRVATVKHIEWTASKHNAYIPVVVFEKPIELEGTQVKRATGYNAKWISDMKIKAGSVVIVRKSNQIIPQIIKVVKE